MMMIDGEACLVNHFHGEAQFDQVMDEAIGPDDSKKNPAPRRHKNPFFKPRRSLHHVPKSHAAVRKDDKRKFENKPEGWMPPAPKGRRHHNSKCHGGQGRKDKKLTTAQHAAKMEAQRTRTAAKRAQGFSLSGKRLSDSPQGRIVLAALKE